jgi:P27 family predicted phage terminase small subunit
MGKRGFPPKPTRLRIAQGDPGKILRIRGGEPQPPASEPQPAKPKSIACPTWLGAKAKKIWQARGPELERIGCLTVLDLDMFAGYCKAYARWEEAEEFLDAHGTVFVVREKPKGKDKEEGREGRIKYIQQYPQVAIAQRYLQLWTRIGECLGLSPAARTRIQVQVPSGGIASHENELEKSVFGA